MKICCQTIFPLPLLECPMTILKGTLQFQYLLWIIIGLKKAFGCAMSYQVLQNDTIIKQVSWLRAVEPNPWVLEEIVISSNKTNK